MTAAFQAFPLPPHAQPRPRRVSGYAASHAGAPEPLALPWPLKTLHSAQSGIDRLPDGRVRCWIRHEVLRGVTPRMLAWWFAHIEGDVEIDGMLVNRYRAWHPADHVHASYAKRLPDGSVGPGAVIRLREMLGGNPRFTVDVRTVIEKLDEEGYIHNPVVHGIGGIARMEYSFRAVAGGTLYENCLVFGTRVRWLRWLNPLLERIAFPAIKAQFWLRHNIEEVGMLENFLPSLYARETGRAD